jgi:hypothetical protein
VLFTGPASVRVPPTRIYAVVHTPVKELEEIRARYLRRNWVTVEGATEALFFDPASVCAPPTRIYAVVRAPVKELDHAHDVLPPIRCFLHYTRPPVAHSHYYKISLRRKGFSVTICTEGNIN